MAGTMSIAAHIAAAAEVRIDAAPYVDPEYADPAMKAVVDGLIAAELRTMPKREDVLAAIPRRPLDETALPLVAAELGRASKGQAMAPLDMARYELRAPEEARQSDPAAWAKSVENAQAQLQHQAARLVNLELLQKHGANAWLVHNYQLEAMVKAVQAEVDRLQKEMLELNVQRKATQTDAYARLSKLEAQWYDLTRKNAEIELACAYLEVELAPLKARAAAAAAAEAAARRAEAEAEVGPMATDS